MDWKDIGKKIASTGATLLGTAIGGGPGGSLLGGIVADALGVENEPDEISKAIDRDPQAAVKLKEIQSKERVRLQEIASKQAIAEIEAETARHRSINETMRAELQAEDNYRGRWRPTFGYVMAFNMAVISIAFFAAVVAVILEPEQGGNIADGFAAMLASFVTIFSLGLGVLGIQVHQRSKDKRLASGVKEPTLLQRLGAIAGKQSAQG